MNYALHRLNVKANAAQIVEVLATIRGSLGTANELLDFDQIIRQPESIKLWDRHHSAPTIFLAVAHGAAESWRRCSEALTEHCLQATGHPTAAAWRKEHWGSISNALDVRPGDEPSELLFRTEWAVAFPAIQTLSAQFESGVTLELHYLRASGRMAGAIRFDGGDGCLKTYTWGSPEAEQLREQLGAYFPGDATDAGAGDDMYAASTPDLFGERPLLLRMLDGDDSHAGDDVDGGDGDAVWEN